MTDQSTGEELGITELVKAETSYFYGSSASRVQNIQTAASKFHGLMVAPGETFSMATALGDITLDNGYAEAMIIIGGQTIKGVGGGVCQVSTTLFRTAFFSGFPIVERYADAYRVYYYEKVAGNHIDFRPGRAGCNRIRAPGRFQIQKRYPLLAAHGNLCQPGFQQHHLEILFQIGWTQSRLDYHRPDKYCQCS